MFVQRFQRGLDARFALVAVDVDKEHVFPQAGARGTRFQLVIDTPLMASGASRRCTAPGLFCADSTSEVLSWPDGVDGWWPSTKKRVVLFGSSSMFSASLVRP